MLARKRIWLEKPKSHLELALQMDPAKKSQKEKAA